MSAFSILTRTFFRGVGLPRLPSLTDLFLGFHGQDLEAQPRPGVCSGVGVPSLLFADDVILLASFVSDLQHPLERFPAECEAAGLRMSTLRSQAMVLCQKIVESSVLGGGLLPQAREFKYPKKMNRCFRAPSVVMQVLHQTVVVKKELSCIYRSVYVLTHTYGHEICVVT